MAPPDETPGDVIARSALTQYSHMDKKDLSERDICTKYITPAVKLAGWDEMTQLREEVSFTKGRIIVRGNSSPAARPSAPITSYTSSPTSP
jgi:hypothetical protein